MARALSENAFEADYKSVDELFQRPNLEHVDQVPLKWKEELITEDRLLVSIGYDQYWKIWRRATWALGLRDILRPYSTRVGAGATLNGHLTPVIRNWILGHNGDIFRKYYQPDFSSEDLMKFAFGQSAGDNEAIFQLQRNVSGRRDEFALVDATLEDYKSFEERLDVAQLRASVQDAVQSGASKREVKRVRSALYSRVSKLAGMKAIRRRAEYEQESDRLRARGLDITALRPIPPAPSPATSSLGAKAIGMFLKRVEPGDIHRSACFITILIAYLRYRPSSVAVLVAREPGSLLDLGTQGIAPIRISQCLLGYPSFSNPRNLIRHFTSCHFKKGTFDAPFECPECLWLGRSRVEWALHVPNARSIIRT
ncbi:hypothetical protein B0T24DRAFT_520226 [Lasiosphaeria ovina]|uniref:FluG domain-containing protein n=1 Tax=Lasiosphaeria ovina TaxID=92902 RepID=A0AAE0KMM8_9PEZI|nr:hypothetical protein B0T24DRAFT_520226 [Lasiosphaeria ovina]